MGEDLERYESDLEMEVVREYRDVFSLFRYAVETDRRFYLANHVDVQVHTAGGDVFFEVTMTDAWVWDAFRPSRILKRVRVISFKDLNVEELTSSDLTV
ncbi:MAG: DUF2469 family protein [Actinomycetaceae bacterium]|nr:DUF2469 family protein [Actinomycetaceae bacterium]